MTVTQEHIAKALGVNQRTISVAFGSSGRISDEMRRKVLQTAREMGYQPNRLAAGLRGAKTNSIGMIWHFADIWSGDTAIALSILKAVQDKGYQVYQSQLPSDIQSLCKQIDEMKARRVDALVISGIADQLEHPEVAQRLKSMPVVVAISPVPLQDFPGDLVVLDRLDAIRQVMKYWAQKGRRKPIFVIDVDKKYNPHKCQVFIEECQRHGMTHENMLLDHGKVTDPEQMGTQHLAAFNKAYPDDLHGVDAIFTFNDIGALYIMRELQQRGVKVPDQVAIVGFNDIEAGRIWQPALASGDRKRHEVSDVVMQMLNSRLAETDIKSRTQTVHMAFLLRASAG